MSAYFVTATGTGVGKSFTSCALLHAARTAGKPAQGYKPIISGWDETDATDTAQIIAAGGNLQSVDEVSPWRFAAPLSPHRAAALEGRTIELPELVRWSQSKLPGEGLTLIEGVGGVMVPLNERETVLDWMAALKLPVILVAGSYLGSISHTLTAHAALQAAGLEVAALVISETGAEAPGLVETMAGLAHFMHDIRLRVAQPRVSSYQHATALHALMGELA